MLFTAEILVEANTSESDAEPTILKIAHGIITWISVLHPPGCHGMVHCVILHHEHQIAPSTLGMTMVGDGIPVEWNEYYESYQPAYELKILLWSPGTTYDHTVVVRVAVLPRKAVLALGVLDAIKGIFSFILPKPIYRPPEPEPAPPPPPPPPPPVCTIGETKCEGFDLYECKEVEGVAEWVLIEKNSAYCGFLPPGPPPPPVCTIGETKCIDYDLFECIEVEGAAQWVLAEENSAVCGYVPPPPPVCIIGETKCEGLDLYECQKVKGKAQWVKIKGNAEECGYVPPPPEKGTIEEAEWEIARKSMLSSAVSKMIDDFTKSLTKAQRKRLEEWTGWARMPEEMKAKELAEWKRSYPYINPYFTYCSYYPEYKKTPEEYYFTMISDYRHALESE